MTPIRRQLAQEARAAVKQGSAGIARAQRTHLREQIAFARANSPFYRDAYADLPRHVDDPKLLPVIDKAQLMDQFDNVVTDRAITREQVEAFVSDPDNVGSPFLGQYLVATSSGTSGLRGLYILDERSTSIESALSARARRILGIGDLFRMGVRAGRTAVVTAPAGHFYSVAATARFQRDHPRLGKSMQVFSINQPLPQLVDELNRFNPAVLSGFLGMLLLLAREQEAGRLRIRPALVIPGGETCTTGDRDRLATVFGGKIRTAYAATECSYLSVSCSQGWYHVNSDWAVVEPVDADFQPVAPGELSHTVLISTLVNRVQPFLRYNLGDSLLVRPDPCPCGSILPAVRVQGRAVDLLTFPSHNGKSVVLSPMHFGTLLDKVPGVSQYQIVQATPQALHVRLQITSGADVEHAKRIVRNDITRLLAVHRADDVKIELDDEPPEQTAGGKFRRVIPLQPG